MLDNGCVSMKGLTKTQEVYLVGRNKKENLGDVPCHVYMEFDGAGISLEKLQSAWSKVFIKHPLHPVNPDNARSLRITAAAGT